MGLEFDECDEDVTDTFDLTMMPLKVDSLPSLNTSNIVPYWLKQCANEHEDCATGHPEWLPTRLINIGSVSDGTLPRLIVTEDCVKDQLPYVTMSSHTLLESLTRLTTSNIQAFHDRFTFEELPKLIQLAVQATRALGFRYLWIEELCIVQDSTEDTANELLDMGLIHANSWITITTASLDFMYKALQGIRSQKNLVACETFPNGDPRGIQNSLADDVNDSILMQRKQVVTFDDALWCQPVDKYTRQHLEDPRSRLARFSCYAEEAARVYEPSYLAGLWRETLVADLLWYVDGTSTSLPDEYCAPTWSWASVTGAITFIPFYDLVGTCYVKIKEAHTNLDNRDFSTGSVVGGYIQLHGYLIEISNPTFFYIRGHHVASCFYPDDPCDIIEEKYFCLPVRKQLTPQATWLCGLVLHKIESSWAIEYRRVGLFRCREGDSLHLLGQKVRGRAGSTFYSYETHTEKGVDGKPFAA